MFHPFPPALGAKLEALRGEMALILDGLYDERNVLLDRWSIEQQKNQRLHLFIKDAMRMLDLGYPAEARDVLDKALKGDSPTP